VNPAIGLDAVMAGTCRARSTYQSEADHCEVVVKSKDDPNARTLHDGKAGGIDSRELMQVRTPEVLP
jgi:hypothetical protein